jgi:hypothetical protein
MLITIYCKGDFEVEDSSIYQCGVAGQKDYKFEVSISGTSRQLDYQGFLVDNKKIADFFDYSMHADSGEKMAMAAVKGLKKLCRRRHHSFRPKRITVRIIGSEKTTFTAEYKRTIF